VFEDWYSPVAPVDLGVAALQSVDAVSPFTSAYVVPPLLGNVRTPFGFVLVAVGEAAYGAVVPAAPTRVCELSIT